jgi:hypothetical protein
MSALAYGSMLITWSTSRANVAMPVFSRSGRHSSTVDVPAGQLCQARHGRTRALPAWGTGRSARTVTRVPAATHHRRGQDRGRAQACACGLYLNAPSAWLQPPRCASLLYLRSTACWLCPGIPGCRFWLGPVAARLGLCQLDAVLRRNSSRQFAEADVSKECELFFREPLPITVIFRHGRLPVMSRLSRYPDALSRTIDHHD